MATSKEDILKAIEEMSVMDLVDLISEIEEKFGFNKTTYKTYILDKLKAYGLTIILGSAIISPILYFFETYSNNGWIIAWIIITCFIIGIQPLFVHVIAPMFNKFTSLEEGELRTAIENFAKAGSNSLNNYFQSNSSF